MTKRIDEELENEFEESDEIVELIDEEGTSHQYYHIGTLDEAGKKYAFFQPAEEIDGADPDDVVIFELDEENDYIRVSRYGKGTEFISIKDIMKDAFREDFGHGGGDIMLVKDFHNALLGECELGTSLDRSVESHLMAITAEKSRISGKVCKMRD